MQPEEQVLASQEAAAVSAPVVETVKTKATNIKKKSKGAVPNKGGVSIKPLYREMVVDAIVTQKERLGSSFRHQEPSEQQIQDCRQSEGRCLAQVFLTRLHINISSLVHYLLSYPQSAEEDA